MVQLFATKEEIVQLIELFLEEAKNGTLESVAIVGVTPNDNSKSAFLIESANANGLLGTVDLLQSELRKEILAVEEKMHQEDLELASITNSVDDSNPQ